MTPLALTTPKNEPLRINPLYLVAWGPQTVQVEPGASVLGSFVIVGQGAPARHVLESVREIDLMFQIATADAPPRVPPVRVDAPASAEERPPAG